MLITAYSDLGTAIDAINRGCVRRYLRKPWDNEELFATLSESLEVYHMRSKMRSLEQRLLEAERVYALGVVTAGLCAEVRRPISLMQTSIHSASEALNAVHTLLGKNTPYSSIARMQLFEAKEHLRDAFENLDRILDTVRGLELPVRSETSELVDVSDVLRLGLRVMQSEVRARTMLELDVRSVALGKGSSTQVAHVVLNLLINALQAMEGQPRSRNTLSMRLGQAGREVVLEIADTGPGIDDDLLPHVFDPFSSGRRERGAGLGLAISKTIVEELGGTIHVENAATGGARFIVRMPAATALSDVVPARAAGARESARQAS
jgi:signal transduction histidine kinase